MYYKLLIPFHEDPKHTGFLNWFGPFQQISLPVLKILQHILEHDFHSDMILFFNEHYTLFNLKDKGKTLFCKIQKWRDFNANVKLPVSRIWRAYSFGFSFLFTDPLIKDYV